MTNANKHNCTNPDVVANLRACIAGSGLKKKFIANAINISNTYLSILLSGKRTVPTHISEKILNFLKMYRKNDL